MKEVSSLHKDMDTGHSLCGKACSCMHNVLSCTSFIVQCSSSNGTIGKSSSSSSSFFRHT